MKISIITPVKDRLNFIQHCIDSVSSQSHQNYEHVIIDGMSKDGTLEIIQKNEITSDKKIRYISENDQSVGEAWNKGLKMADGDIIGWLGADDSFSDKNSLAIVAEFFYHNQDAYVVYGGCNFINEKDKKVGSSEDYIFNFNKLLNKCNYIPATSLFFKKSVIEKVGFYDAYGNDFDYVLRIAKLYKMNVIPKILSNFILATDSETGDLRKYVKVLKLDWIVSKMHGGYRFNSYHRRYLMYSIPCFFGLGNFLNKLKNLNRGNY